jgi:hypothetical protein
MINLSGEMGKLGRYEEAEKKFRTAYQLQNRVLGSEAPNTLRSRVALVNTMAKL